MLPLGLASTCSIESCPDSSLLVLGVLPGAHVSCLYPRETPKHSSDSSKSSRLSSSMDGLGLKHPLYPLGGSNTVCAARGSLQGPWTPPSPLPSQGAQREAWGSLDVPTFVPRSMQSHPGLHKAGSGFWFLFSKLPKFAVAHHQQIIALVTSHLFYPLTSLPKCELPLSPGEKVGGLLEAEYKVWE